MSLDLRKLSTKILATYLNRTIAIAKKEAYQATLQHQPFTDKLERLNEQYQKSYTKLKRSGLGEQVAEANKKRWHCAIAIQKYLKGYLELPMLGHKAEAEKLLAVFKTVNFNSKENNYATITAKINHLFQLLESEEMKAHITAVNLTENLAALKESHQQFEKLMHQQIDENAQLVLIPAASTLRVEIIKTLRQYLKLLEIMKKESMWKPLYQEMHELNKIIEHSDLPDNKKPNTPTDNSPTL